MFERFFMLQNVGLLLQGFLQLKDVKKYFCTKWQHNIFKNIVIAHWYGTGTGDRRKRRYRSDFVLCISKKSLEIFSFNGVRISFDSIRIGFLFTWIIKLFFSATWCADVRRVVGVRGNVRERLVLVHRVPHPRHRLHRDDGLLLRLLHRALLPPCLPPPLYCRHFQQQQPAQVSYQRCCRNIEILPMDFYIFLCTILLHSSAAAQISLCRRIEPRTVVRHWQSDAVTTLLDLIHYSARSRPLIG